jgi:hypothetical protein
MAETALAAAVFVLLALTATLLQALTPFGLLRLGLILVATGAAASCLTGALYHIMLAHTAACRQGRVPRWWWSPTQLHPLLTPQERPRVLCWFYAGAASFCAVVAGALYSLLAVARLHP